MLTPSALGFSAIRFPSYRQGQDAVSIAIAASSYRFSNLQAPTGTGKSLIYCTSSKLLGLRTLVLVVTKNLQSQLESDFSSAGMYNISGHTNYACATAAFDDDGEMLDIECRPSSGECYYRQAVAAAAESNIVVTNYAHWVHLQKVDDPHRLGKFDLVILDEAHSVDLKLVDYLTVNLNRQTISALLNMPLPKFDVTDISTWIAWAHQIQSAIRNRLSLSDSSSSTLTKREAFKLNRLYRELVRFTDSAEVKNRPWAVEKTPRGVDLKPVWSSDYTEEYIYRGAQKVVLSSATLTKEDAAYLGIPSAAADYHEVDSNFNPRRSPFVFVNSKPRITVDRKMGDGDLRMLVNRFDSYIDRRLRLGRKGIIQSVSYDYARRVQHYSRHAQVMMLHDTETSKQVIDRYRRSTTPCILVSPSVGEGYNFPHDECRWQIILKVPFVYSGSPVTAARLQSDKGYVNYLAARSIVQMAGRPMRSMDDWGETAIFDGHWSWFRNKAIFPKWFRVSWQVTSQIPEALDVSGL